MCKVFSECYNLEMQFVLVLHWEERYYQYCEMCTSRMLYKWRETYEANTTWGALVNALWENDETNLAQQLEEQHIKIL